MHRTSCGRGTKTQHEVHVALQPFNVGELYNSVKGDSRVNVPDSEAVFDDLQKRFAVRPKAAAAK